VCLMYLRERERERERERDSWIERERGSIYENIVFLLWNMWFYLDQNFILFIVSECVMCSL
jgi:hypothetical protein